MGTQKIKGNYSCLKMDEEKKKRHFLDYIDSILG